MGVDNLSKSWIGKKNFFDSLLQGKMLQNFFRRKLRKFRETSVKIIAIYAENGVNYVKKKFYEVCPRVWVNVADNDCVGLAPIL